MHFMYILQSLRTKRFYIGVTENRENRLKKHNQGNTPSTKPYRPWQIIYCEEHTTKEEAYKREYYLKHPQGYKEKRKLVETYQIQNKSGGVA